jgi:two-component system, cell cycle sensor histidine kinase and response regulator CckA
MARGATDKPKTSRRGAARPAAGGPAGGPPPLQQFLDSSPMGIHSYELTPDDRLLFLGANPASDAILGVARTHLIGHPIEEVFPALAGTEIPGRYREVARHGGRWSGEEVVYRDAEIAGVYEVHAFQTAPGRMAAMFRDVTSRRRAEEALRESEERYRQLFVLESDAIFLIADETGQILEVNPAAALLYGYTREELLARKNTDLSAEPDRTRAASQSDSVLVPIRWHRKKDGTVFPVEIAASRLVWHGQPAHLAAIRDISRRLQGEAALRESRAMLAAVLDAIPVRVFWKDRESRYLGCNRPFARAAGLETPEALAGKTDEEMGWAAQAAQYRADDREVLTTGRAKLDYEEPQTAPDGSRTWLRTSKLPLRDVAGEICGVLGIHDDVTEEKRAAAELRARNAQLTSIFRAAPVGIGVVVHRVLREVNERICEMTGYSPAELLGQSARLLYPTEAEFALVGADKYRQIAERGIGSVETRWRRKDGAAIDVLLSSVPLDPADFSAGVTFTALDITGRKRAEEERLQLERQIQHVQKLESLGVLAGGIAHDFNNLLMAILGHADLALMGLSPAAPARASLDGIVKASRRAAELCQQMLAYSGRGRFVVQTLDLAEVVREMAHMLEVSVSKKAVLRYDFPPGLPGVEADATQLRQVIMNLVLNASEAIGERSGVIAVVTGAMRCDRAYLAGTTLHEEIPEGLYVFLEVTDTGCGMDAATRTRIFDPFFTTKFTGRGLGLAAVLGIVRGHKGAIKVYSEPGKGSTFKVLFPALRRSAEEARHMTAPASGWRGAGTILLVDDEETIRSLGTQMLQHLGFTVLTAADGREALEVFRAHGAAIACVLLDLTMPHMDGAEAFRELRRLREDVRVVLSSGYSEQEVTQRFVGKGLAGFIQKPYQSEALAAVLRRVLGGAQD